MKLIQIAIAKQISSSLSFAASLKQKLLSGPGPRLSEKTNPKLKFTVFVKNPCFNKFESADFIYENSFFKFHPKTHSNKTFLFLSPKS